MSRIAIETAKPAAHAWGVFVVSADGAKVEPCEAYALDASGNLTSGDGDDITAHIASGRAFVTYEGHVTEAAAKASADEANASYARGVADFGWKDNGARYEVRPLPAGTVFYVDEVAHVVAAPSIEPIPVEITESTLAFLRGASCRRTYAKATLQIVGDEFVMTGPSGRQALAVAATDLGRLNTHWRAFATHPVNAADAPAPKPRIRVKRVDEFTKCYQVDGLECEIRTSDSYVTVSRDGAPVATLQRAGYFERIEGKPAWRMVALDGTDLAEFRNKFDLITSLLLRGAKALRNRA